MHQPYRLNLSLPASQKLLLSCSAHPGLRFHCRPILLAEPPKPEFQNADLLDFTARYGRRGLGNDFSAYLGGWLAPRRHQRCLRPHPLQHPHGCRNKAGGLPSPSPARKEKIRNIFGRHPPAARPLHGYRDDRRLGPELGSAQPLHQGLINASGVGCQADMA